MMPNMMGIQPQNMAMANNMGMANMPMGANPHLGMQMIQPMPMGQNNFGQFNQMPGQQQPNWCGGFNPVPLGNS